MQLPLVAPAPIVEEHAHVFRDLFENRCQFQHFVNYLTGLMVLENKSLSSMSRCMLASADKTNLSRFLSESPWCEQAINKRRVEYMVEQTQSHTRPVKASCLILDDTLCEHVGSLFEHVARHYDHCENRYPLAHNLVTSHFVSGAVRFPVDAREYRRYEEMTQWETFVRRHFPEREIPKESKARASFHKEVDSVLLQDPDFALLHEAFQTKLALAGELIEDALQRKLPFGIVLMDSWYLAQELVELLGEHQLDWVSLLKTNRNLETASFTLKDAQRQPITLKGPHIQVENWMKLIPASAYKLVKAKGRDYWCFGLNLRVSGLGKVRLVVSFDNPDLTGTYAVLITNRCDWTNKQVLETYLQRWPIETFYQDAKGHLGLDEYRMRAADAIQKHWHLVFVAYSLLHLECLPTSPDKRRHARPARTIGDVCRQQAQALIQKLILFAHERLQQGQSANQMFAMLFAKQPLGILK